MFKIVDIVFSGVLLMVGLSVFNMFFGPYFGFVLYHLNLAGFLLTGGVLEPTTVRMVMFGFIIIMLLPLLRKIKSVFGS